jgi:cobalt-zinc-cadmium resistance protein CzcA
MRHPWLTLLGVAVLTVATTALGFTLGSEFIPRLNEGTLVFNTIRLASVGLDESQRYGTRVEQIIKEEFPDEVRDVWTRTGTAEVATDPMGLEISDVFVGLYPREHWKKQLVEPREGEPRLGQHASGGHHAVRRARATAKELGQDGAQAGVIGIAELAVLQQLHRMVRVQAGLHPGHADMRTPHVGGQERRHRMGQGMGRYRVGGCGHTGSLGLCRTGPTRRLRRSL